MIDNPIIITNAITLSDGGTKYLVGNDRNGNNFSILIAQHIFTENFDSTKIPGRLHFNENPIEVRSDFEKEIIKSLENCLIRVDSVELNYSKGVGKIKDSENLMEANGKGHNYGVAYLIKYIIDFVESENYTEIANNFKTNAELYYYKKMNENITEKSD